MGIRRVENMCGGKGHVIIKDILEGDELKGKCGLYAQVTIEKGCSLGYHEHHGETETFVPVLILAYLFLLRLKNNAVSIPAREMTITILHSKIFVLSPVLTAVSGFVEVVGCSLLEIIEMTAISL